MISFFDRVLPKCGIYSLILMINGRTQHYITESKTTLVDTACNWSSLSGDLYFALASYKQGWHKDPSGRDKQVFRTHNNVLAIRSFWLDIDVGESKGYKNLDEAILAMNSFIAATGLPYPMLVVSGRGLHVYWPLDADLQMEMWRATAKKLQAVTKHYGLQVDPARTSDPSSILRVPGTTNWKDPAMPLPVYVYFESTDTTVELFTNTINNLITSNQLQVSTVTNTYDVKTNNILREASGLLPSDTIDRDATPIIMRCKQIQDAGLNTEPVWFGMMSVMKFCFNGDQAVHALSARDSSRYDTMATTNKFEYAKSKTAGPMRCDTFNDLCPGICNNCPYFGHISSPIEFGRESIKQNTVTPQDNTDNTTIQPQETTAPDVFKPVQQGFNAIDVMDKTGYSFANGCVHCRVSDDADTGNVKTRILFDCIPNLKLVQEYTSSATDTQLTYVWSVDRNGVTTELVMPTATLVNDGKLVQWLADYRLLPMPALKKKAMDYMRAYVSKVQNKLSTMTVVKRFGWMTRTVNGQQQRCFAIGNHLLVGGCAPEIVGVPPSLQQYSDDSLQSAGTFEEWQRVSNLYNYPGGEWGKLAVLMGFGAVLMHFHNDNARNCIINFYSNGSGTGKSTSQNVVCSIWGDPEKQMISTTTDNAMFALLEQRNNLPFCLDEITNKSGQELSDLVFTNAGGVGKYRMNQKSEVVSASSWHTLTLTSANNTIGDKLSAFASSREGEQRRAIDIYVPERTLDRGNAAELVSVLKCNYGHAGKKFIQYLLDTPGVLDKMSEALMKVSLSMSDDGSERFWTNAFAAAYVAGCLCKAAGILNYDMQAMYTYMISCINRQRSVVKENATDGVGILQDFIADRRRQTLIVASATRPHNMKEVPGMQNADAYIKFAPTGEIDIRVEQDTNTVYIRSAALKEWCAYKQHAFTYIIEAAIKAGYTTGNTERIFFTRGISSATKQQSRGYKLQLPSDFEIEVPKETKEEN